MPSSELAYWNYNIPSSQQTATCPDYLLHLSDKDKRLIGAWDDEYEPFTWTQVQEIVTSDRINLLRRSPLQLRRYLEFVATIKHTHGSIIKFILHNRLHWDSLTPSAAEPFDDPSDWKVLRNDWPYGVDARIVHLVVWTKFELEDDVETGRLTEKAKALIEAFLDRTFRVRMEHPAHLVWFKNWKSLKSVTAVEHFHVMLYEPDPAFVEEMTQGDVPLNVKMMQLGGGDDEGDYRA